uniref:Ig-like domain-containing protein n=1 Tax=Naja naja TaxID=35670 RepID=A0A8C6V724_NAJNA
MPSLPSGAVSALKGAWTPSFIRAPFSSKFHRPPLTLFFQSLLGLTQTPSFVNGSTGTEISFRCSVDEANYKLFWYQQLPGKTELKVLGNFYSGDRDLQEKHKDWKMRLDLLRLQANDTGFYLCAAVYTVNEVGIEAGTKLNPKCDDQPRPSVILLSPVCHKKRITLVCLAQGFHYEWPLDVIWERDGQKITRLSSATEPVRKEGECNFATASRLSVLAEEWQKGHNYSCHVNQTGPTQNIWVASFAN